MTCLFDDLPLTFRPLPTPTLPSIFAIESLLHGRYTANHDVNPNVSSTDSPRTDRVPAWPRASP